MEHTHDSTGHNNQHGLFYTYFGETGAAVVALLYFLFLFGCIFSFVKWG